MTETPEGELRVSDAEREQVAAELGRAVGEGRLTLAEFSEFAAPEVTITRWSLIGGIDARVPTGVRVEVSGFSLLGGHRVRLPEPTPGAPVLRLRLFSILGGVSVKPR